MDYRATEDPEFDPAANRTLRVRQMAILALGAIGDPAAVPSLASIMNDAADPRLQIAAAKAILEILDGRTSGRRPDAPGAVGGQSGSRPIEG